MTRPFSLFSQQNTQRAQNISFHALSHHEIKSKKPHNAVAETKISHKKAENELIARPMQAIVQIHAIIRSIPTNTIPISPARTKNLTRGPNLRPRFRAPSPNHPLASRCSTPSQQSNHKLLKPSKPQPNRARKPATYPNPGIQEPPSQNKARDQNPMHDLAQRRSRKSIHSSFSSTSIFFIESGYYCG